MFATFPQSQQESKRGTKTQEVYGARGRRGQAFFGLFQVTSGLILGFLCSLLTRLHRHSNSCCRPYLQQVRNLTLIDQSIKKIASPFAPCLWIGKPWVNLAKLMTSFVRLLCLILILRLCWAQESSQIIEGQGLERQRLIGQRWTQVKVMRVGQSGTAEGENNRNKTESDNKGSKKQ